MATLNAKTRGEAQTLLGEYNSVGDVLKLVGKKGFHAAVFVANDKGNEDASAGLDAGFARTVLNEQKLLLRSRLKKLGIDVD